MQPTLMKFERDLYISLHVDDLLMVGTEEEFMEFLGDKGWKCEVQGQFDFGESFEYVKRKIDRTYEGFVIRPDPKHIEDIAKKADIKIGIYKKTEPTLGKEMAVQSCRSRRYQNSGRSWGRCSTLEVSGLIASLPSMLLLRGGQSLRRRHGGTQSIWRAPGRHGVLRTAHQEQQVWEVHAGHERNAGD